MNLSVAPGIGENDELTDRCGHPYREKGMSGRSTTSALSVGDRGPEWDVTAADQVVLLARRLETELHLDAHLETGSTPVGRTLAVREER